MNKSLHPVTFVYLHKSGGISLYDSTMIVKRIKHLLLDKDMTAKTMLSDLGMGINTLRQIESGRALSYLSFAKIADYLDVSIDYLLGRTDNPEVNR